MQTLSEAVTRCERQYLSDLLARTRTKDEAAKQAGLTLEGLRRSLLRLGLADALLPPGYRLAWHQTHRGRSRWRWVERSSGAVGEWTSRKRAIAGAQQHVREHEVPEAARPCLACTSAGTPSACLAGTSRFCTRTKDEAERCPRCSAEDPADLIIGGDPSTGAPCVAGCSGCIRSRSSDSVRSSSSPDFSVRTCTTAAAG